MSEDVMYDPAKFALSGQVAIVTGAGAGIGRGIARVFAGAGAAVVVSDLKAETAKAVADEIVAAGGQATSLACNVTKDADLQAVVQAAIDHFGKLTILVNNAGGGGPKPFDMAMDDFRWAYELNVFSVFRLSQLAAPHIEAAGGGAILNISSMAGENKNQRMASYASSKAAENHLTRNIAFDLGPRGIRVNAIAPGAIKTDALASVLNPDIEKAMLKHTPLGRLGEAEDIANAALFLCSPCLDLGQRPDSDRLGRRGAGTRLTPRHHTTSQRRRPMSTYDAFAEFRMTGHNVIITGGAQNIGAGIAKTLSGAGAKVMIADLNGDMAAETAAGIARETGNDCRGMACNVTDAAQIDAVVAATVKAFGGISTLVNNVGWGGRHEDPAAISDEDFIASYKLNTISAYRMSMACLPHLLKAENATITNSGSMSSVAPAYDILAYGTAKAALNQMMISVAHFLNKKVRVNSVLIGTVMTAGYADAGIDPEMQERLCHPDNLTGSPGPAGGRGQRDALALLAREPAG
jgi:7-alpha-hydroxysteroid dehydrogenase